MALTALMQAKGIICCDIAISQQAIVLERAGPAATGCSDERVANCHRLALYMYKPRTTILQPYQGARLLCKSEVSPSLKSTRMFDQKHMAFQGGGLRPHMSA
jgi:hypothetical protein